jgi:hypothetical protein
MSPTDLKYPPPQGTHLFMSRNALKGIEPQTYLDDLESFYHVLLYIARIYMDTELSGGGLLPPLTNWENSTAASAKNGYIMTQTSFSV